MDSNEIDAEITRLKQLKKAQKNKKPMALYLLLIAIIAVVIYMGINFTTPASTVEPVTSTIIQPEEIVIEETKEVEIPSTTNSSIPEPSNNYGGSMSSSISTQTQKVVELPTYTTAYISSSEDEVVEYLGRPLSPSETFIPSILYIETTAPANPSVHYYIVINSELDYPSWSPNLSINEECLYTEAYIDWKCREENYKVKYNPRKIVTTPVETIQTENIEEITTPEIMYIVEDFKVTYETNFCLRELTDVGILSLYVDYTITNNNDTSGMCNFYTNIDMKGDNYRSTMADDSFCEYVDAHSAKTISCVYDITMTREQYEQCCEGTLQFYMTIIPA